MPAWIRISRASLEPWQTGRGVEVRRRRGLGFRAMMLGSLQERADNGAKSLSSKSCFDHECSALNKRESKRLKWTIYPPTPPHAMRNANDTEQ